MAQTTLEAAQITPTVPRGYIVTLGDATNEVTEETILSATIPADDWSDNEKIEINFLISSKQDAGYGGSGVPIKLKYGATSHTLAAAAIGFSTSAVVQEYLIKLWRVGTSIYVFNTNQLGLIELSAPLGVTNDTFASPWTGGDGNIVLTSQAFNADKDITITAQWDEANANNVIQCVAARVIKT